MTERSPLSVAPPEAPSERVVDLELLRVLEQHPDFSQRQLSRVLGVSLGKTHYLLKALLAKGWIKAQNFRRSDNKLGYLYVLTPTGVRHRLRLTQSFLARKEAEYRSLRREIATLREELDARSSNSRDLPSTSGAPFASSATNRSHDADARPVRR